MLTNKSILTLLTLGSLFAQPTTNNKTGDSKEKKVQPIVINGSDHDWNDFPSLVSLRAMGSHTCGGVLISEKVVLTAGHCCLYEASQTSVRALNVGGGNGNNNGGNNLRRRQFVQYPGPNNYQGGFPGMPQQQQVPQQQMPQSGGDGDYPQQQGPQQQQKVPQQQIPQGGGNGDYPQQQGGGDEDHTMNQGNNPQQQGNNGQQQGNGQQPQAGGDGTYPQQQGENNGSEDGPYTEFKVSQIIKHEQYSDAALITNDVAVWKLSENVPTRDFVKLDTQNAGESTANTQFRFAGWGRVDPDNEQQLATKLQYAELPLVPLSECNVGYSILDAKHHLCAGFKDAHISICQGDSGGPLMLQNTVVGLASFVKTTKCNDKDAPPVFSRVYGYLDWIKSKMQ